MPATTNLRKELDIALNNILRYWKNNTIDEINGGFVGRITQDNQVDDTAAKGLVLQGRLLWSFSAAYKNSNDPTDLALAERAYHYIKTYGIDPIYGGVYWSLTHKGEVLEGKKQTYAIAFVIYGLSAYYEISQDMEVLAWANKLVEKLEKYAFEPVYGGYIEALGQDWSKIDDVRLSDKDLQASKTMNTHLHIIEAYSNLYRVAPNDYLKEKIDHLLSIFDQYIINGKHLILFMNNRWESSQRFFSFGHDIEASWLLLECAETIQDKRWIKIYKRHAIQLAEGALEGFEGGALNYEYNHATRHLHAEKHWWVQAEALVGFYSAYTLTQHEKYLKVVYQIWSYIKSNLLDTKHGEWFWGRDAQGELMLGEDKVGIWKCPYHNTRACLELLHRIPKD